MTGFIGFQCCHVDQILTFKLTFQTDARMALNLMTLSYGYTLVECSPFWIYFWDPKEVPY